ncbi:MAG TPA: sulfite exporter TauE/SafE family protein [Gaiellaceae bacterium]|nr:sulfite exporter TauE/SafE family protein [Gaiellaceae bacterium]
MSALLAVSADHVVIAVAIGTAAGVLAGLFGVGGGILFVPALTIVLGLEQHHAEATSLLAILPTVAVGAWRQERYGNVRWRPALVLGIAGIGGVVAGGFVASALSGGVLKRLFGVLLVLTATQLVWRARKKD